MNDCILCTKTCVDLNDERIRNAIFKISTDIGKENPTIKELMIHFNVNCEMDLWACKKVHNIIGDDVQNYILERYFKVVNKWDVNYNLTVSMVRAVVNKWELHSEKLFNKKVHFITDIYSYFMDCSDKFRDLDIDELLIYDAVGIKYTMVFNGRASGHAAAIYIDVKKKSILYFESSGRTPEPHLQYWFDKLILELKSRKGLTFTQINVVTTPIQIEDEDIQCAIWSLVFVLSQLNGYHYKWISTLTVADIIGFKRMIFKHSRQKKRTNINDTFINNIVYKIWNFIRIKYPNIESENYDIVELMDLFQVNCEMDLWKNESIRKIIGNNTQRDILIKYFKVVNTRDINESMRIEDIEKVLHHWELNGEILFNKNIYFISGIDSKFMEIPNEIRDLYMDVLLISDAAGFIYHTTSNVHDHGHVISVYIDVIKKVILYFDAEGYSPPPQLQYWFDKLILELKLRENLMFTQINVVKTHIQVEDGDVQCGMWSLVFILSQLNGFKPEWISSLTYVDILRFKGMILNHLHEFNTY